MGQVTPEKVVAILKQHNENISLSDAVLMIQFMQALADIEIKKILNHEDSGPLYQGEYR